MATIYSAAWVLPISAPPLAAGAIAIQNNLVADVGTLAELRASHPDAEIRSFGNAAIVPGFVNSHSHLELSAMRGFLDTEEGDFFAWLQKLTMARLQRMSSDDLLVSAAWGACEALRAGVTCVADASDAAAQSMKALNEVGLRGVVYQETFGPDPKLARENFDKLVAKVEQLRSLESDRVRVGVSPHAPYTVCGPQLEMISDFALSEELPVMMHAAESLAEKTLLAEGKGSFAEGYAQRGIAWESPSCSTIAYLQKHGVLKTRPLLAHCINVDDEDIETIAVAGARIAHCPKSNAKLGHGRAPFAKFIKRGIAVGLGSDSVASNNTCDLLEEARFALLLSRLETETAPQHLGASDVLDAATRGGAHALGLEEEIGELRAGFKADFAIVSLAGTHQQPTYDPVNTLIFTSSGGDVVLTVVNGKEVYQNGRVVGVDEERLRARMGR